MIKKITAKILLHLMIFILLLIPLFYEIYLFLTGQLGAVIDDEILHFSGDVAISYFIFIFIFQLFFKHFARSYIYKAISKEVGIAIFLYTFLHILIWLLLKQTLNINNAINEIYQRGYLLVGFISFLIIFVVFIASFTKYLKIIGKISIIGLVLALAHFLISQKNPTTLSKMVFIFVSLLICYKMINPSRKNNKN